MNDTSKTPLYTAPGDILSTNAEATRTAILALVENSPASSVVELDLRATRMIDSVGLNLLVGAIKAKQQRGGEMRILVSHPGVQRILTFTRIDKHATIVAV